MSQFEVQTQSGFNYTIRVEEVSQAPQELLQTLVEIDLQTFAESTFSRFIAASFLSHGGFFLMKAEDVVIGSCICIRRWDRSSEAMMLSMGIRPGWRGRGLGHHFVNEIADILKRQGMRALVVLVGSSNERALKLYEEAGFQKHGETMMDAHASELSLLLRRRLQDDSAVTPLQFP